MAAAPVPGNYTCMQSLMIADQVSRCIPLAIGYGIILALFYKSRRDLKRFYSRMQAPSPVAVGQGTAASRRRTEERALSEAIARSRYLAARAELLGTYRRGTNTGAMTIPLVYPHSSSSSRERQRLVSRNRY